MEWLHAMPAARGLGHLRSLALVLSRRPHDAAAVESPTFLVARCGLHDNG